mgnify:CR=1 FL=1
MIFGIGFGGHKTYFFADNSILFPKEPAQSSEHFRADSCVKKATAKQSIFKKMIFGIGFGDGKNHFFEAREWEF